MHKKIMQLIKNDYRIKIYQSLEQNQIQTSH